MSQTPEVLAELLPLFQSESEERLGSISAALEAIEESPDTAQRSDLLERLLRELHSLKGGARAVNLTQAEAVSHAFESVLVRLQSGELSWTGEVLDACNQTVGVLEQLVHADGEEAGDAAARTASLLDELRPAAPEPAKPEPPQIEIEEISPEEAELIKKLLPVFRGEADERLESIASSLEELRAGPESDERRHELFETVMRDAHSMKGGARTMKLGHISALCKEFEYAAAKLTRREVEPYPALYDLFERAAGLVQSLLEAPENLNEGLLNQMMVDLASIEQHEPAAVEATAPVAVAAAAPATAKPIATRASQTVRVATEKLDNVLRQAQEMLVAKLAMRQRGADLAELAAGLREWRQEWSRVDTDVYRLQSWVEKHDEQSDDSGIYPLAASAVRFLEWSQKRVRTLETQVRELGKRMFEDQQSFGVMVDTLVDETKRALMLPLSTLFKGLPRMVREVARTQEKALDFDVRGEDLEVDKRILDEMRDPLMHLLRNSVDHGIEPSAEREAAGKTKRGQIVVEVSQPAADEVALRVADDGRGIDTERVRAAAVKNGVLTEGQSRALDRAALLQLIFRSGVSTSETVSNISGRGLGMAICREGIERLGGSIQIESEAGQGTSFHIRLPLALATYRILMVQVGRQTMAVPTANTERVLRLSSESISSIEGKETVDYQGAPVSLQRLDRFLGMEAAGAERHSYAVIVRSGGRLVAFAVQRVIDEQEVLFKDLGSFLEHNPHVSGATILGTGSVVPILNVPEMIDAVYAEHVVAEPVDIAPEEEVVEAKPRSILVVEDSITSRMLLKEILESAGYLVSTAINGVEAVAMLEQREFDLVVSDVEMPKMNGFELTERVRADERWTGLPLILVTGLERDEERERGLAAGADEYIIKGSFEQSNLLAAISRLCGDA